MPDSWPRAGNARSNSCFARLEDASHVTLTVEGKVLETSVTQANRRQLSPSADKRRSGPYPVMGLDLVRTAAPAGRAVWGAIAARPA